MNKSILIYAFIFLISIVAVSASTIVSDTTTDFYDGANWVPAVAAWVHPAWTANVNIPGATWIWSTYQVSEVEAQRGSEETFRKQIELCEGAQVDMSITTDNSYVLEVNGQNVGQDGNWETVEIYALDSYLQSGLNTIMIYATNAGQSGGVPTSNPAGVIFSLDVVDDGCGQNDVPEFGTIGALILVAGAAGLIIFKRK